MGAIEVRDGIGAAGASDLAGAAGAWVWDLAAGQLWGDARFASLYGVDADAAARGLPSEAFFEGVHPDDRMRLRIAVAGVEHGTEIFARDYRLALAEGVRWVSARGRAEHDAEGRPLRFSGVLLDITEQKRVEERLRIAQSAGGVGTFEFVEGFGTATVSDQFCRLLGLHLADALPVRTINAVVDRADPPLIRTGREDPAIQAELRIRRADTGEARWIALRGERRRDAEHAGLRFIGVIYDITETKAAEAKLQELARTLEERVEARTQERDRIWNNTRDLFAVVDGQGVFRAVNPAWGRMLGYGDDEVLGCNFRDLVHADDLAVGIATAPDGEAPSGFDARIRAKDGAWRWVNWTVIPEGSDYYAIGRDVT
jgi:PAS domain S-box-containing protein